MADVVLHGMGHLLVPVNLQQSVNHLSGLFCQGSLRPVPLQPLTSACSWRALPRPAGISASCVARVDHRIRIGRHIARS